MAKPAGTQKKPTKKERVDDQPVVLTDPRSIRAIAHPARLKVIDHLFQGNVQTSTELAELTGLSASAMSYHLRALEKWGIVARVDPSATGDDGRERPWRQAGSGVTWSSEMSNEVGPLAVIMKQFLDELGQHFDEWTRFEPHAPIEWKDHSIFSRGFPWLTVDEANQFADGVMALLKSIGAKTEAESTEGAKRHAYVFGLVPMVDGFPQPAPRTKLPSA